MGEGRLVREGRFVRKGRHVREDWLFREGRLSKKGYASVPQYRDGRRKGRFKILVMKAGIVEVNRDLRLWAYATYLNDDIIDSHLTAMAHAFLLPLQGLTVTSASCHLSPRLRSR